MSSQRSSTSQDPADRRVDVPPRCTLLPLRLLFACLALAPSLLTAQQVESTRTLMAALRAEAVTYEHGNGVARDGLRAAALYCEAARLGDADAAYALGWMHANGRGVPRDDALAASFFNLAAARGIAQAEVMLRQTGAPSSTVPECLRARVVAKPAWPEPAAEPAPFEPPRSAPRRVVELVKALAPEYRVPPALVWAIMKAESNFNADAVSPKNAQGLMQLIPQTATRFRVKNPFDPAQNVRGGIAYLRWLLAYFEGDVALVAAAYNAGEGAVERHGGVPPYAETRAYVRRIVSAVGSGPQPFDASIVDPSVHLPRMRERLGTR